MAESIDALNGLGFTSTQIAGMSATTLSNLKTAQFDAIAINDGLGAIVQGLTGITASEISSLTAAGLAEVSTSQIAGMTAAAQADIKSILAAQTGIKNVLAEASGGGNSSLIQEIQLLRNADPGVVHPRHRHPDRE